MSTERLRDIIRNLRERLSDSKRTCASKITAQKNTTRQVKENCKIKKDEIKEECKIKKNAIKESLRKKLAVSREHHAPGARKCHRDLASANQRLEERQREQEQLQGQHDALQNALDERTEQRDNLIEARNNLQAQLNILHEGGNPLARIAVLEGQLANVQQESKHRAEQIVQLTAQRDALQRELDGTNENLPVLEEVIQTLTAQQGQLQTDLDRVRQEKLALEQQMADVNARHAQLNDSNRARIAALELANQHQRELIEEKNELINQANTRLEQNIQRIAVLTQERDQALAQIESLRHELEECNRNHASTRERHEQSNQRINDIQQEMRALQEQLANVTRELQQERDITSEMNQELDMYRQQIEEMNTTIQQHNQRIETLDNEIAKLQRELQTLRGELHQCRLDKDNMSRRLKEREDHIIQMEAAMAANATQLQRLEAANKQYIDQLTHTHVEHTERTRGIQNEHSLLVQELQSRLDQLNERHESSLERLHRLDAQHNQDTAEKAQLHLTINGLTQRTNELSALLEECIRTKDMHLGQLTDLTHTSSSEKERLVSLHQADIEELRRRNESLATSLSIETEYKERLIRELAVVKAKLAHKEQEFQKQEDDMKRVHDKQLAEIKQIHQQEIKELERVSSRNESVKLVTEEHAKTLQMMRDSHQKDLGELERSHQANVTALKDEHLKVVSALKKEAAEMNASYQKSLFELDEKENKQHFELLQKDEQLKQKDEDFKKQKQRLDTESGKRTAAEQQVEALRQQIAESERMLKLKEAEIIKASEIDKMRLKGEIQQLIEKCDADKKLLDEAHKTEVMRLNALAEEKVNTVNSMLHQQIETLKQKLKLIEDEKKEFDKKTQRLGEIEEALRASRTLNENEKRQAETSMEQIKSQHVLEKQRLMTQHQQELARITADLEKCNATLPAQEASISQLRKLVTELEKVSLEKDVLITSSQRLLAERAPRMMPQEEAFAPRSMPSAAQAPEVSVPLSAQEASRTFSRLREFKENPMVLQNVYQRYGIMSSVNPNSLSNYRGTFTLWPTVESATCLKTSCYKPYYDLLQTNAAEDSFVIVENWYGGVYPFKVETTPNACKLLIKHLKGVFMFDIEFLSSSNQVKFGFYKSVEEPLTETLHLDVVNISNVPKQNLWNLVLNEAVRIIERDR